MPALIPVALAAGLLAAEAITIWAFWATIASVAIGQWQAARARRKARDAFNANLRDRLVSVATTTGMRSRCYGRVRNVDGVLFKATHGPDLRYYTFVVAVAGHEVEAIDTCYFNDTPLTLDGSGYVTTTQFTDVDHTLYKTAITISGGTASVTLPKLPKLVAGDVVGAITTGTSTDMSSTPITVTSVTGFVVVLACALNGTADIVWNTTQTTPLARVRFYTGSPGQDLSGPLIAAGVPLIVAGVHRFEGIACMLITLDFDLEAYPTGVPQFSAVLRGARCFDRRFSVTDWTQNPAVIADDWSQYAQGGGLGSTEINAPLIIASANACDVVHTFNFAKVGDPPSLDILPMYTCGIVCKTDADPADTLAAIVESMAGQWGWASGNLRIKGGFYTAPVLTIDDTWFADGERQFSQGLTANDLVNVYNAEIADANAGYTVQPVASVRAAAYITADGRELPRSLTLEGVTDVIHAQHICGVLLRHARQGFTCQLPCNFKGIQLELFDTVAVTLDRYGLAGKTMDVVSWGFTQEGGTTLTLKETAASIFDPDALFTLLDAEPNTNLPLPWVVPQVTGVVVVSGTALLSDRSIVTRTRVSWDAVPAASVLQSGKIEIQYLDLTTGAQQWQTVEENGDATETTITGLMAGHWYQFRVRAVTTLGVRGAWSDLEWAEIAPTYFDSALDATSDIVLIARGQCTTAGNHAEKISGAYAWDSDVYSKDFAYGACMTSAVIGLGSDQLMFGLNSDPTTDQSYTSLDHSWYWTPSTGLSIYEAGASVAGPFTAFGGDVLSILYDGSVVRYLQAGVLRHTSAAAAGAVFFFDSSFAGPNPGISTGSFLDSIRFAQLSANDWASIGGVDVTTDQIHPNAATEVFTDEHDFAGATFGTTTARTFTRTPVSNCRIEITGALVATTVLPDAGNTCNWFVTPASTGVAVPLPGAGCPSVSTARTQFTFHGQYDALGGDLLTFELRLVKAGANPVMTLGMSQLRLTEVKR